MEVLKSKQLKVMVDANVLLRGVIHPRFAFEILNHALKSDFRLILLPYTIEEAIRNVDRRFPDRLPYLENFLVQSPYQLLKDPTLKELQRHKNLIRDETDIPLAVAAIQAKVDYLVTNDKDFVGTGKTTRKIQEKVYCITAGKFLREVMGRTSKELKIVQERTWTDMEQDKYL